MQIASFSRYLVIIQSAPIYNTIYSLKITLSAEKVLNNEANLVASWWVFYTNKFPMLFYL